MNVCFLRVLFSDCSKLCQIFNSTLNLFLSYSVSIPLSEEAVEGFLFEATMMKQFQHPNVMSMFGISVFEKKPCVLLPLLKWGNVEEYLKKNKEVDVFFLLIA